MHYFLLHAENLSLTTDANIGNASLMSLIPHSEVNEEEAVMTNKPIWADSDGRVTEFLWLPVDRSLQTQIGHGGDSVFGPEQ